MDFFIVVHDIDNYEEWINLDRIVLVRCSSSYDDRDKKWTMKASILFDNGEYESIHLTEQGWEDFKDALMEKTTPNPDD